MQGGRDPFFGFGDPFGSFGGQRSLVSNFFGGRNPFDDPFFNQPFGGIFQSSLFTSNGGPFMNPHASGFLERPPAQPYMSRGPVIQELNSDDEKDETESEKEKKENPRKHGRPSKEPVVDDPDDEVTEKKSKHLAHRNDKNQIEHARSQPQMRSFTFQSSSVTYGGANGAYYTSSTTRRAGSDGLAFEEFKEADSSTRQATHRVTRGIRDKGHSLTRKLQSDGHVESMQTLHNLNQDDLVRFEEAWEGNAVKHLPGWSEQSANRDVLRPGRGFNLGNLALPSTERPQKVGNSKRGGPQQSGRVKSEVGDATGRWRGRSHQGSGRN